ncbi:MAG: methyl-accepting chemotaxis protein [Halioglobus sp.]
MTKAIKGATSTLWLTVISVGILACLCGVGYTFYLIQQEAGQEDLYRVTTGEMRLISQDIASTARETASGSSESFQRLQRQVQDFDVLLKNVKLSGLDAEVETIETHWLTIEEGVGSLVEVGPRVTLINNISAELEENIRPIQSEFAAVVDILRDENVSPDTVAAAQKTLWLTERIARNIGKILAGGGQSQSAADEFRNDAAMFSTIVDALKDGNRVMGVERLTDSDALDSINTAYQMFDVVSRSVTQIAGASPEMRLAAVARENITTTSPQLTDAVASLVPALERQNNARLFDRGTLMALFVAPAILAVGLLITMYRDQRRRVEYTERGVAAINRALVKISEGDLTVLVPEDNEVTREIAKEINASTDRQRELIRNIRVPFEVSVGEINKIGKTARGQVDKGKQLTRSVVESTTATTEMVRTSEEIKVATGEAAKKSDKSRQQIERGYDLTQDMSRASADVRESVQETSKSAKRQGELIQSVTTAAEYIQSLNTKISVVAINTRIEAEKAGEHGRPFLGIAEAIGDLLREAEEEGRKIISEVRMLQNMSAENLNSMENTVGTVVTILEYIDRLDSALKEINEGSTAISDIVRSVDDAAGQSAVSAQHMNSAMSEIRERNIDISEYSEFTQIGVSSLQKSMHEVADNLSQFRIEQTTRQQLDDMAKLEELQQMQDATKIYGEAEMSALEMGDDADRKVSG